jgi:hypothetical protein
LGQEGKDNGGHHDLLDQALHNKEVEQFKMNPGS